MPTHDHPTARPVDARPRWTKSSRSVPGAECVEVATAPDRILIRDSKDPTGPHLTVTIDAWAVFVAAIRRGALR